MKKIWNKIIWMPYCIMNKLVFLFLLLVVACGYTTWFNGTIYPEYVDCTENEGIVERFGYKSNQTNHYISLELQDGRKFYILEIFRETYNWTAAFQTLKPGVPVEVIALNEKDSYRGPRVMTITCNGQSYLTSEQTKAVYQDIETESRKAFMMFIAVSVITLFCLSVHLSLQRWYIRKLGRLQYLRKNGNGIGHQISFHVKSLLPFFPPLLAVCCIGKAWPMQKDWNAKLNIPIEQECDILSGAVQEVTIQNGGDTLCFLLNDDRPCYAEKGILGETYFSKLSEIQKDSLVEFSVYTPEMRIEKGAQILAFSGQEGAEFTYQQGKDCYLLDAVKSEKPIASCYFMAAFLCSIVAIWILWMRKREGAKADY